MKYYSPGEIREAGAVIRRKFQEGRPLPLKGRCLHLLRKFVPNCDDRILECGPGAGRFLDRLHSDGYRRLFASDIDHYLLPDIRAKLMGFAALDLSFDRLPWDDSSFDAVCAWEFLEHLENPHNAIRETHRVLRPGGFLMISLPNVFHIVSRLVFLSRGVFPQWNATNNHISIFPRGIFDKTILKYFDLVEVGYVGSGVNLPLLKSLRVFPENEWFGRWVYYVLKKRETEKPRN